MAAADQSSTDAVEGVETLEDICERVESDFKTLAQLLEERDAESEPERTYTVEVVGEDDNLDRTTATLCKDIARRIVWEGWLVEESIEGFQCGQTFDLSLDELREVVEDEYRGMSARTYVEDSGEVKLSWGASRSFVFEVDAAEVGFEFQH